MDVLRCTSVVVVAALALGACNTPPPPTADWPDSEAQARLVKLRAYTQCLDLYSPQVFEIADLYRARPASSEDAVVAPVPVPSSPDACVEDIEAARQRRPAMAGLDEAAAGFAQALENVTVLAEATHRTTPPRPADAELRQAFDTFDRAQAVLFDEVYAVNRSIREAQLAERAKTDGPSILLHVDTVMFHAEAMARFGRLSWDRLAELDRDAFARDLARLEEAFAEMSTEALAHPKEVQKELSGYQQTSDQVIRLLAACRLLAERARMQLPYSDVERLMIAAHNEGDVVGTPAALVRAYNQLVAAYFQ